MKTISEVMRKWLTQSPLWLELYPSRVIYIVERDREAQVKNVIVKIDWVRVIVILDADDEIGMHNWNGETESFNPEQLTFGRAYKQTLDKCE